MAKKSKKLTVTYLDGREVEVMMGPKAQVMAERHFGKSLMDLSNVEEVYYLGWCCLTVAGLEHLDFDSFLDVVDDVDMAEGVVADRPTPQAQQSDSSSN